MTAGKDLRKQLDASLPDQMEWDERDLVVLGIASNIADSIAELELQLRTDGLMVKGSMGQLRMNPVVTELRLQRSALARILEGIRLPNEVERPKSVRHQRAGRRSSWKAAS